MAQEFYLITKQTIDDIKSAIQTHYSSSLGSQAGSAFAQLITDIQGGSSSDTVAAISLSTTPINSIWIGTSAEFTASLSTSAQRASDTLYLVTRTN